MEQKIALIVGRFQPFHKGHLFLIKKALENADKIVIGIGSANITDENNPIDFETRKKLIKAVFYKEKISDKLIKIVALDDFFDDKKWLNNLKNQVGSFDIALGNNDWTNNILKKAGYKVLKIDYYKRGLYEGWRIRKLIREEKKWQDRVPKYLINFISNYPKQPVIYNHVVLGGTFDHFHKGHQALITKAFQIGKVITVGIATEELYKNKFFSDSIESFSVRKNSVKKLIKKSLINSQRVNIISFSDIYGITLKEKNINAIVISRETFQNALKINEERQKIYFKPLQIVIIEDVLSEDGKLISSERIRTGEIDREGKIYKLQSSYHLKSKIHELLMPESLRPILQKPLGKVFNSIHEVIEFIKFVKPVQLIAVGDIIADSLIKNNLDPDVKIIDFRSRRKEIKIHPQLKELKKYKNKPGTINLKTAEIIQKKIKITLNRKEKSWIVVEGEEDLLTLPVILFTPLKSLVLYGHWQLGIIAVYIDEKIKNKVREIIKKFN